MGAVLVFGKSGFATETIACELVDTTRSSTVNLTFVRRSVPGKCMVACLYGFSDDVLD